MKRACLGLVCSVVLALPLRAAQPSTLSVEFRVHFVTIPDVSLPRSGVVVICRITESNAVTGRHEGGRIAEGVGFAETSQYLPATDALRSAREEAKKEAEIVLQRMFLEWKLDSEDRRYPWPK